MSRSMEREVEESLSVGIQGACCLTGILTTLFSLGFAPLAGLIRNATKAPPIEEQLIANKLPPARGRAISAVSCRRCGQPNEEGQIECLSCGLGLVDFPEFKIDTLSPLQVQWLTLFVMGVIGLLILFTRNPYIQCVGMIFIIAAGGWALTLIIPTVQSWQQRRW